MVVKFKKMGKLDEGVALMEMSDSEESGIINQIN